MMASQRNLPEIAQDAVPRTNPLPTELQPLVSQEVASALPAEVVGLSATTVNMLNNTTNNGPENVMIISKCKGVHVGNTYSNKCNITLNKKEERKRKKKPSSPKPRTPTQDIQVLLSSSEVVTTAHVKDVRIGKPWRFVMRNLGLDDVEIENKHEECIHKGIPEVVYQLLRLWIQKNASAATLDKLSKALWAENQNDALFVLAMAYGISSPAKEQVVL